MSEEKKLAVLIDSDNVSAKYAQFVMNEVQKYGSSASKGVVERTSFRGDWIELAVRVHGDLLIAKRDLEEEPITVGETVDVFLYRLFVIAGEKCYLLENQSLQDDSVFI